MSKSIEEWKKIMEKYKSFEEKHREEIPFSDSPHKFHSDGKRCCCGGHSANDGDKQYKGRQYEKNLKN